MFDVTAALPAEGDWTPADARRALGGIREACLGVAARPSAPTRPVDQDQGFRDLLALTRRARELAATNSPEAAPALEKCAERWIDVEGQVAATDRAAYTRAEGALGQARTALRRQ